MKEENVIAARLLLGFAKLSKSGAKYFTTHMNQYLLASPVARRQMIKVWEVESQQVSKQRADAPTDRNAHEG